MSIVPSRSRTTRRCDEAHTQGPLEPHIWSHYRILHCHIGHRRCVLNLACSLNLTVPYGYHTLPQADFGPLRRVCVSDPSNLELTLGVRSVVKLRQVVCNAQWHERKRQRARRNFAAVESTERSELPRR